MSINFILRENANIENENIFNEAENDVKDYLDFEFELNNFIETNKPIQEIYTQNKKNLESKFLEKKNYMIDKYKGIQSFKMDFGSLSFIEPSIITKEQKLQEMQELKKKLYEKYLKDIDNIEKEIYDIEKSNEVHFVKKLGYMQFRSVK